MESIDVRLLEAVAAYGSLTSAAQRLGYAQSSVTARVDRLEREFGATFLVRGVRGAKLTPAGELFVQRGRAMLAIEEDLRAQLSGADEPHGILRIGSLQATAATILPDLLKRYHERYRSVRLSLETGNPSKLAGKLLDYEIDAAFSAPPLAHPELEAQIIAREDMVLLGACATKHQHLDELLSSRILIAGPCGCVHLSLLEEYLTKRGIEPPGRFEFSSVAAILSSVVSDLGVTVLPSSVARHWLEDGSVVAHDLPEPHRRLDTLYVRRKNAVPTAALLRFEEMALAGAVVNGA